MRNILAGGLTALTLLGTSGMTSERAASQAVSVTLDPSHNGPVIDRHIFGQFAEHLGHGIYDGIWVGKDSTIPNVRGIRSDVVTALKALHVPDVRWPGGCFADEYHWRRGIGPADQRKPAVNTNWGGVTEPNSFGTEEYMDFIQQIGSEAYVSINVGSGTPQEASEWLEYMTASAEDGIARERINNGQAAPYRVAFMGIGNEAWGCGGSMTPDFYIDQLRIYSRVVHNYNLQQPMKRIAVGPDGVTTEYTEAVMKAWKGRTWAWDLEGLSLHAYTVPGGWPPATPSFGFDEKSYSLMLHETLKMDSIIRENEAVMDKYDPEKKIALVVDEWGAWLAELPGTPHNFLLQQNSQRDAVLAALNINIFARHASRVRMANIAQMINVLQAMILTDKEKMVLTPTYHVFRMYVPFQDAHFVPVAYEAGQYKQGDISLPKLDVIAARDASGKLWVSVTNLDAKAPASITLDVQGQAITKANGQTLSAPSVSSINTFDAPHTVTPKPMHAKADHGHITLTLAPASVSVVSLEP